MKKVCLICVVIVVLDFLMIYDMCNIGAQTIAAEARLEGECYLAIINDTGIAWDQVRLNGERVGELDCNAAFIKNFQCGGEKVIVELYSCSIVLKKELTVIKGPATQQNPMNKFIWKLD